MIIDPAQKTQKIVLIAEKVAIPAEYLDYANIFSKKISRKAF